METSGLLFLGHSFLLIWFCYFFTASKKYRKKDAALRKIAPDSSFETLHIHPTRLQLRQGFVFSFQHESITLHFLMREIFGNQNQRIEA
jgi:hypothetical protein